MSRVARCLVVTFLGCLPSARAATTTTPAQGDAFAVHFTGKTLRCDYHHCGTANEEHIAPDRVRLEGDWPGSQTQLLDTLDLGKYRFVVRDAKSGDTIWSTGFSSIYGEWETTSEAKTGWRALHESQRFPEPKGPVILALDKRQGDLSWKELWRAECDPGSRFVDRSPLTAHGGVMPIIESGPAATKVDLLIVGDGYTGRQRDDFIDDVHRLTGALFATEPFKSRRSDFNVRAILAPAPQPGVTDPRRNLFLDTPMHLQFNAFDTDRYMLTFANLELRELAAQAPYDTVILLANTRKYGGGGIYHLWCTCAADTEPASYVFVHEFGHSFGGLADEYYTSQVAYESFTPPGTEPWEPNITALLDPAKLKWKDLVAPETPLPTPWDQATYDALDLVYQQKRKEATERSADDATHETLMRAIKLIGSAQLAKEPSYGKVGAFQGGGYEAKALYRPSVDCIMFTRNPTSFCHVCERAISRVIDTLTR